VLPQFPWKKVEAEINKMIKKSRASSKSRSLTKSSSARRPLPPRATQARSLPRCGRIKEFYSAEAQARALAAHGGGGFQTGGGPGYGGRLLSKVDETAHQPTNTATSIIGGGRQGFRPRLPQDLGPPAADDLIRAGADTVPETKGRA